VGVGVGEARAPLRGFINVDKPRGPTSFDVVRRIRRAARTRRVGHAGTLDPDATGVLLVGLGRVTRLMRYLQETTKSYRGRIVFGVATDTLDASGAVLERAEMALTRDQIERATRAFTGDIEQVPPMVSALKVGGKKLYELARKGQEVERASRRVHVSDYVVESFEPGPYPEAVVRVDCSSGTYVRTLAADLGTALGGCAHLASLQRLRVGSFTLDEAHAIDAIEGAPDDVVVPPADALRDLARVAVGDEQARAVSHGATFAATGFEGEGPFAVVDERGDLLAVYERRGAGVKPAVVLATEAVT
jgi:tRNA pseudouridine55 synthase